MGPMAAGERGCNRRGKVEEENKKRAVLQGENKCRSEWSLLRWGTLSPRLGLRAGRGSYGQFRLRTRNQGDGHFLRICHSMNILACLRMLCLHAFSGAVKGRARETKNKALLVHRVLCA